jgi:hypothetical protein
MPNSMAAANLFRQRTGKKIQPPGRPSHQGACVPTWQDAVECVVEV